MHCASSKSTSSNAGGEPIKLGVLAPLSPPGWAEAGQHLLAGIKLAAADINAAGGIQGTPLELVVRDTAGSPAKAVAAVDELVAIGVSALAGEYHSVAARAVAERADARGLPYLCSSAVLDTLIDRPSQWVARLAPPQSCGWSVYSDFLLNAGHRRIALAMQPSVYWEAGADILRRSLEPRGGSVLTIELQSHSPDALNDAVADRRATALLLLTGYPEPCVAVVQAVRRDRRLKDITICAPAGQPEFAGWTSLLGDEGSAIPFLRYLPQRLTFLGESVGDALSTQLAEAPSFVAFEGYDTLIALAELLRSNARKTACTEDRWGQISIAGTRGVVKFTRTSSANIWQWPSAPIQVVQRNPMNSDHFQILHSRP